LGLREPLDERAEDGEAAEAGIEDANGGGHGSLYCRFSLVNPGRKTR
jgi:hypothetical protein